MSADNMKARGARRPPRSPERSSGKGASWSGSQVAVKAEPAADGGFRPSLLFVVASFVAAAAGIFAAAGTSPVNVVFVALAIGTVGAAAFLLYRTIWPLVG